MEGKLKVEEEESQRQKGILKNKMVLSYPDDISFLNMCLPRNGVAIYVRHSG